MTRSLPEEVFPYLAIGLAKYVEGEQKYPYPDELSYALNQLSLAMLTTYPGTITDLFELFEKPLERWWPGTLPSATRFARGSLLELPAMWSALSAQ